MLLGACLLFIVYINPIVYEDGSLKRSKQALRVFWAKRGCSIKKSDHPLFVYSADIIRWAGTCPADQDVPVGRREASRQEKISLLQGKLVQKARD